MDRRTLLENGAGLRRILRALQHRNYRLYFMGQGVSQIGTWMQRIALAWLVYRLTHSAFLLGLVGFCSQIPFFFLTPFAGVLADRLNRRGVLIVTQTLAMVQALLLAMLVLTDRAAEWHIVTLSLLLGIVDAFDMPTRHSFLLDLVEDKNDLASAIGLNATLVNSARLIGPSFAGVVVAALGEGVCFLLNGLSFFAVLLSLLAIKTAPRGRRPGKSHIFRDLKEGASYSFGFAPTRAVLLLVALVSLVAWPYQVLMPVFAKDVLHGGPQTLGFLTAGAGIGALIGITFLASRNNAAVLVRWIPVAAIIFGGALTLFSLSRFFWFSFPLLIVAGFGMIVQHASSNTVLQTVAEEEKRGRVVSFFILANKGITPFGSLLAGGLAAKISAPATLILGGIACLLAASLFYRKISLLNAEAPSPM